MFPGLDGPYTYVVVVILILRLTGGLRGTVAVRGAGHLLTSKLSAHVSRIGGKDRTFSRRSVTTPSSLSASMTSCKAWLKAALFSSKFCTAAACSCSVFMLLLWIGVRGSMYVSCNGVNKCAVVECKWRYGCSHGEQQR